MDECVDLPAHEGRPWLGVFAYVAVVRTSSNVAGRNRKRSAPSFKPPLLDQFALERLGILHQLRTRLFHLFRRIRLERRWNFETGLKGTPQRLVNGDPVAEVDDLLLGHRQSLGIASPRFHRLNVFLLKLPPSILNLI